MKRWLFPVLGFALGTLIAWLTVAKVDALAHLAIPLWRWLGLLP